MADQDSERRDGPGVDPPIDRGVDPVQSIGQFLSDQEKAILAVLPKQVLELIAKRYLLFNPGFPMPAPEKPCRCIHCVEYE